MCRRGIGIDAEAKRGSMVAGRTGEARLSMDPAEENGAWVDQCVVVVPSPPRQVSFASAGEKEKCEEEESPWRVSG